MGSTPPKVKGSPNLEQWLRWAEGELNDIVNGNAVRDTRVEAVTQVATNVGNIATDTRLDVESNDDDTASTNRFARPLRDKKFWDDVIAGKRYIWDINEPSPYEGVPKVVERSVASPGQIAMLKEGDLPFVSLVGTAGPAQLDVGGIYDTPPTGKLYVDISHPLPAYSPTIQVTLRSVYGAAHPTLPQPLPIEGGKGVVEIPPFDELGLPTRYSVAATCPAGEQRAFIKGEIFEIIGSGTGTELGPDGVLVTDDDGNDLVVIKPDYPPLTEPTAPALSTSLGVVIAKWDGGSIDNVTPPANFAYIRMETSASASGPWQRVGQTISRAGEIMAKPPIGEERWYRFIATDTINKDSPASAPASIAAIGVMPPDLDDQINDAILDAQNNAQQAMQDALDALNAAGDAILSVITEYAISSSETVAPTTGWSTTAPARTPGTFIWSRTTTAKGDGTITTSSPVLVTGNSGTSGAPGAPGKGVASVTPYYILVGTGSPAPAKPTANPPGGGWSLTEPAYVGGTELYSTTLTVMSDSTFSYSNVSKVSAYTAASQAITVANLADAAAKGLVKASQTDPGHAVGRVWLVLDGSGNTIGIKLSNGSAWSSYMIVADQLLVPSSVGNTLIANGAITTPKVAAKAITAQQMLMTDIQNYFNDPTFSHPSGYLTWTKVGDGIEKNGSGTQSGGYAEATEFPVTPGDQFVVTATRTTVSGAAGSGGVGIYFRGYLGTSQVSTAIVWGNSGSAQTADGTSSGPTYTIPSGVDRVRIGFYSQPNLTSATRVRISDVIVRRKIGGSLIVDGSILGVNIAGETITGDNISAGTLKVSHVVPEFGDELNLSANDAVTIIVGRQDDQDQTIVDAKKDIDTAQKAADKAGKTANDANKTAGTANSTANTAKDLATGVDERLTRHQTYYRFGTDGLSIGDPAKDAELVLQPERIAMVVGAQVQSEWVGGVMITTEARLEKAQVGNHQHVPYGTDRTVIRPIA